MNHKYISKYSKHYESKQIEKYFNSNFTINTSTNQWEKEFRIPTYNESADIFLVKNQKTKQICIAKSYNYFDLDQIDLIKRLDKSNYTEIYIDDTSVHIDNEKRFSCHFLIFDYIPYSSSFIPEVYANQSEAMDLIFQSLDYIHRKRILHNDIKPNNIMFDGKNIKLIDFEYAVDFKTKKYNSLEVLSMYKHPKMWKSKGYFSKNKDYWAAICSIYFIYHNNDIFEKFYNEFKLNSKNEPIKNYYLIENFINEKSNDLNCFYKSLLIKYF